MSSAFMSLLMKGADLCLCLKKIKENRIQAVTLKENNGVKLTRYSPITRNPGSNFRVQSVTPLFRSK